MKNLLLIPMFAVLALLAQPVLAEEHVHSSGEGPQATQETAGPAGDMDAHEKLMQESVKKMQAQMAAIHQTKDPKKRQKLLQEHSRSMLGSMKMMHDMMGGMSMQCPMMSGHTMGTTAPAGDNAAAASPAAQAPAKTASADPAPAGDGKKVWTCPMHPDVVSDQPGICPKCGMELVEVDPSGAAPSGQMGGCMMGGGMKGGCMMGGGMKGGCMMGGGMKGGCMMGGGMKGGCMMGGGMKGGCMMGGGMMGMHDRHMGLMLMLMEQMIEHNDAATGIRK